MQNFMLLCGVQVFNGCGVVGLLTVKKSNLSMILVCANIINQQQ